MEFCFQSPATGGRVTWDILTSGQITQQYNTNFFSAVSYTLTSAAFTRATNFTVLTNTLATAGSNPNTSLVGNTLSINVPQVSGSTSQNLTYTIQLEFVVSDKLLWQVEEGPTSWAHMVEMQSNNALSFHCFRMMSITLQCTEGLCCTNGAFASNTTSCRWVGQVLPIKDQART